MQYAKLYNARKRQQNNKSTVLVSGELYSRSIIQRDFHDANGEKSKNGVETVTESASPTGREWLARERIGRKTRTLKQIVQGYFLPPTKKDHHTTQLIISCSPQMYVDHDA
jgi:hypothetical protein